MPGKVHEIEPRTLEQMMREGRVILIDVREAWELNQARLSESHWNPTSGFDVTLVPREAGMAVVFHCAVGVRSRRAAQQYAQLHDEDAFNLAGGLNAWEAEGLPVQRASKQRLPLQQQVIVLVGLIMLLLAVLTLFVDSRFAWGVLVLGVNQVLVGFTGMCWMSIILGKLQQKAG